MSILVFYSKSAHKKAGFGKGEFLQDGDNFEHLNKIENWRRILSNFHYEPFTWNGSEWLCIEEAFQAEKFGQKNYEQFKQAVRKNCENIDSDIGLCAQKKRKWKVLNKQELEEWDLKKHDVMKSISFEKYKQSKIGREVLLATNNATLLHFLPRKTFKCHFIHLEEIREYLRHNYEVVDEANEDFI